MSINRRSNSIKWSSIALCLTLFLSLPYFTHNGAAQQTPNARSANAKGSPAPLSRLAALPGIRPRNVIFILTDDQRFDALGFMHAQPFLETPNMDAIARNGVHLQNAFVTSSLCSPSRASILTGLYAHRHHVIDNQNPVSPGLVFFPQYLQQAGYETAFIGKWHMGNAGDEPQPGFDHWISFRGQGSYLPNANGLNIDGKHVPQKGYITDELTDYALDWLKGRKGDKPFFLYLSHKAVHSDFIPAARYKGRYKDKPFTQPKTINPEAVSGAPMWVQNQRNSWHGVDYPYHSNLDIADYYRRYAETLLAVDESIGRITDYLKQKGLLDSTLIVFMGDNGFAFGEHGLIDKRTAYEESMRVPLLMQCPELFKGGTQVKQVVANIDIAPTILEAAGLRAPDYMDGKSFLPLAEGKQTQWRDSLLYEYYWERNFPQTPTMQALRGDKYKYIHYYGLWDTDELYDIQADSLETKNLIRDPSHREIVKQMNDKLFQTLAETDGLYLPLNPSGGKQSNLRRKDGAHAADFPSYIYEKPARSGPASAPDNPDKSAAPDTP